MRTADAASAKRVADDLTANYKTPAVAAQTETEYYEKLNNTNQQFLYTIVFIVIIMAVGGVFGVMNAMFAAVSQRTKDIGVLRILGYARWQVLTSFFLESLLLAVVGGLLGCAVGCLGHGWTATSIAGSGAGRRQERGSQADRGLADSASGNDVLAGDGGGRRTAAGPVGDAAEAAGIAAVIEDTGERGASGP